MNSDANIKDDLQKLAGKLKKFDVDFYDQMKELELREEKWKKIDQSALTFLNDNKDNIVKLNISGKKFHTRVATLLRVKDTLFYKLILSKQFDLKKEIFFDRPAKMFPYLIDYLRHNKIIYERFSFDELEEVKAEADYYEIHDISDHLANLSKKIEFVGFDVNNPYIASGISLCTTNVKDLHDRSMMKGFCAYSPGCITIELNYDCEIEEIEVGGYNGNTTYWSPGNGAGATVLTSRDKTNWISVGALPNNFGYTVVTVILARSTGRYIRFMSTGYLGIGFLELLKKK